MIDSSCIFIDGFIAWIVVIYIIFQFIMLCVLGCAYLDGKKMIAKKEKTIKKLRADNNVLLGMYIRDTEKSEAVQQNDGMFKKQKTSA